METSKCNHICNFMDLIGEGVRLTMINQVLSVHKELFSAQPEYYTLITWLKYYITRKCRKQQINSQEITEQVFNSWLQGRTVIYPQSYPLGAWLIRLVIIRILLMTQQPIHMMNTPFNYSITCIIQAGRWFTEFWKSNHSWEHERD